MSQDTHKKTPELKQRWVEMAIREISTQSKFAKIAYSQILTDVNTDEVCMAIHSFLGHCAIVSKLLKSIDSTTENEASTTAETIGDILGIPFSSPVHERKW